MTDSKKCLQAIIFAIYEGRCTFKSITFDDAESTAFTFHCEYSLGQIFSNKEFSQSMMFDSDHFSKHNKQ